MKKHFILAALAMVISLPAHAQTVNDTNIGRTVTAVEKAAMEQGFINRNDGAALLGAGETAPPQHDVIGNHSVMMMAPQAPEAAETRAMVPTSAPAAMPSSSGNRPSLIKQELPAGLVMDGPGTEAYKKRKRKRAAAAKKQEAAPVRAEKPAEKAIAEPASRPEPVALPDQHAVPPTAMPEPSEEPVPAMEPAPGMDMPGMDVPGADLAPPDDPFGQ